MKVIAKPRHSNKTSELIKLSAQTGYYIVCRNQQTTRLIVKAAKELKLYIPFPLTYTEWLEGRYSAYGVKGVLIDDVDALCTYISNVPVIALTVTVDDTQHATRQDLE